MNKLIYALLALCLLTACSSDEPNNTSTNGNGSIPPAQLEGIWYVDRYYVTVKAADASVIPLLKEWFESSPSTPRFPKAGRIIFRHGQQYDSSPPFVEGELSRGFTDPNSSGVYGDYFTKGDTIYHHGYGVPLPGNDYETGKWVDYYLKKGNRIIHRTDLLQASQRQYPNAGITEADFYTEYKK
ncbi:MAG: hypothetical protein RL662_1740 [Bacteroidota bacterium]|jgi:hypothetical protein